MRATCYHLRDLNGQKLVGGSMPADIDLNDAARYLTLQLDVAVTPSGRVSFMHRDRPVWVYLSVDPSDTDKARAALAADRQRRADAQAAQDAQQAELDALIDQHGLAGAIAKLKG